MIWERRRRSSSLREILHIIFDLHCRSNTFAVYSLVGLHRNQTVDRSIFRMANSSNRYDEMQAISK
jgi:hypothetical protein